MRFYLLSFQILIEALPQKPSTQKINKKQASFVRFVSFVCLLMAALLIRIDLKL